MEYFTYSTPELYVKLKGSLWPDGVEYWFKAEISFPVISGQMYDDDCDIDILEVTDKEGNDIPYPDLHTVIYDAMRDEVYRWWLEDAE